MPAKGTSQSAEAKARISAAKRGHTTSEATRAKISAACRGAVRSPETRAKMRAARLGKPLSESTREKLRTIAKARPQATKDAIYASKVANGDYKPIGSRFVDKKGYVWIKVAEKTGVWADQWRAEHRLVVEAAIGRRLATKEHVHHLDDTPANNSLENLLLLPCATHSQLNLILNTLRKGGPALRDALLLTLRARRQDTLNAVGLLPLKPSA